MQSRYSQNLARFGPGNQPGSQVDKPGSQVDKPGSQPGSHSQPGNQEPPWEPGWFPPWFSYSDQCTSGRIAGGEGLITCHHLEPGNATRRASHAVLQLLLSGGSARWNAATHAAHDHWYMHVRNLLGYFEVLLGTSAGSNYWRAAPPRRAAEAMDPCSIEPVGEDFPKKRICRVVILFSGVLGRGSAS